MSPNGVPFDLQAYIDKEIKAGTKRIVVLPGKTVLRKADGVESPLALDGDFGEEQITVVNPKGFEVGFLEKKVGSVTLDQNPIEAKIPVSDQRDVPAGGKGSS